jgi:hypothetical protein
LLPKLGASRQIADGEAVNDGEIASVSGDYLQRAATGRRRLLATVLSSAALASLLAVVPAPTAAADDTGNLKAQVDAARRKCPPLQPDPVLDGVAQRANHESQSYIEHTARFVPFEDPMPVLRELGYPASKAKLIPGYGDVEAKAIHGVTVQGWQAIPDCSYTNYGLNVLTNANGGYVLAALVLAGN